MAYMTAVDSSSLSNQNIATPLLTHTYTNTTRVRKLFASIEADQVFGTGEYVVYATIQRGGAGAVFRAGSEAVIVSGGTTSLMFQALPVVLNVGDVLKTYIVGRGSDTTTPDITTRIWEESAADSGLDAPGVAAAVWDAVLSSYNDAGSTGEALAGAGGGGGGLDAAGVRSAIGLASANLDTQLADLPTNSELSAAIAAGDDATLGAIAALNNLSAAEAQTAAGAALTAYDAATGADVSGISVPTATQIADAVLSRGVVNIEDTADAGSLAELLLGAFESAVSGTTWTIRKTGGGTFSTRTVATDQNADPIVSVT